MTPLPDHPFQFRDLPRLGLARHQLDRLVADGVVRRVLRGVYCRADLPDTFELRASCAGLVLPPHAVLCDRSAAWLWGVDCFDYAEHEFLPRLEVVSVDGTTERCAARCTAGGAPSATTRSVPSTGSG